jgi:hypothetical protein
MTARTLEGWRLPAAVALSLALLVAMQGCRIVSYSIRLTGLSMTPATVSIAATTTQQFTLSGRVDAGRHRGGEVELLRSRRRDRERRRRRDAPPGGDDDDHRDGR